MLELKATLEAFEAAYLPNWLPLFVISFLLMTAAPGIAVLSTTIKNETWGHRCLLASFLIGGGGLFLGIVIGWY